MAASAHLLLSALSKQADVILPAPSLPLPDEFAFGAELPLTSEPPLADAEPLTSEPALIDVAPLTSEPTPSGPVAGLDASGI
ncbi:hypothetical protein [Streptomyces sp. bgisy031]|uniref:hypothetical protein n=1 Tax=Streptomyces sp. bgisy031 TaxID=3413772 RepID=UPI003D71EEAC